jgi:hypothetical protein
MIGIVVIKVFITKFWNSCSRFSKNTILNYAIILQPQYYRRNRIFFSIKR